MNDASANLSQRPPRVRKAASALAMASHWSTEVERLPVDGDSCAGHLPAPDRP